MTNPFVSLGNRLRYVREERQQSLAEVSGAVEIDERTLEQIEAGQERPSEDILLLLISHFGVQDMEAVKLWELADYTGDMPEQLQPDIDVQSSGKVVMLLALDLRTVYSDGLEIATTPAGLTLNFTQDAGKNQATPVARVGMSHEQAERVLIQLAHAVLYAKANRRHRLPPGQDAA